MPRKLQFTFQRTARDGGRIRLGGAVVAEIRRLALVNFRPARGAAPLVGADVGVPLYWRQYANHQDPERSADSRRQLSAVTAGPGWLRLEARGATQSGSMQSEFTLTLRTDRIGRICCEVTARLQIPPGPGWLVTPHPDHGEVTFCTLWPAGVFAPDGRKPKRYQVCLVQRGARVWRIEHHHLESPDKHHLRLRAGDRFAWALEDVNPVLTLGAGTRVEAGVCAYMWDTHFGLKICRQGRPVTLRPGTVLSAAYTLEAQTRKELRPLVRRAQLRTAGAAADTPAYTGSRHTFRETFRSQEIDRNKAWPWQREVVRGPANRVAFARDTRVGRADSFSLRIRHVAPVCSRWLATTLGPAFGEKAFRKNSRLRLRAWVRTRGLRGSVRIALRVHRAGRGSVFDVAGYEIFASPPVRAAGQDWCELTVTTPVLSPAPDRVHLLLELDGTGSAWFDDVELTRLR